MSKRPQPKPMRVFQYSLVAERMEGLLINVDRDLQKRHSHALRAQEREFERCISLLLLMVRFAKNSYEAVRYLTGDTPEDHRRKPNFVLVVPAINRQLLDLLFSLVYMLDDFSVRSLQYERAGWRELKEETQRLRTRFANDQDWKQYFKNADAIIETGIRYLGITKEEIRNPRLIPYWKHPYELKDEKTRSRPFLKYLEKWLYADTSAQAHLSSGGLGVASPFLMADLLPDHTDELLKNRPQYHFKHFSRTALVTLAIATEVDAHFRLGNASVAAYLWNILADYSPEALEMLRHRYEPVFASANAMSSAAGKSN